MFGHENNDAFKKSKTFNLAIRAYIKETDIDWATKNQLLRSTISIMLNSAEGSGRFTKPDRRHFAIMARSSLFETMAILELLKESQELPDNQFKEFYDKGEEISKILYSMIKTLSQTIKN